EEKAIEWIRKAAAHDLDRAQYILGSIYEWGQGPRDYKEAATWYRKAADKGSVEAMLALGGMLEAGRGIPQDNMQALVWFYIAAERSPASSTTLNLALGSRDFLANKMGPTKAAEAERLAHEWRPSGP